MLVLTGFYDVRTGETGTTVYDTRQGRDHHDGRHADRARQVARQRARNDRVDRRSTRRSRTSRDEGADRAPAFHVRPTTVSNATSFFFDTLKLDRDVLPVAVAILRFAARLRILSARLPSMRALAVGCGIGRVCVGGQSASAPIDGHGGGQRQRLRDASIDADRRPHRCDSGPTTRTLTQTTSQTIKPRELDRVRESDHRHDQREQLLSRVRSRRRRHHAAVQRHAGVVRRCGVDGQPARPSRFASAPTTARPARADDWQHHDPALESDVAIRRSSRQRRRSTPGETVDAPITATIPAGEKLVVEIDAPDGTAVDTRSTSARTTAARRLRLRAARRRARINAPHERQPRRRSTPSLLLTSTRLQARTDRDPRRARSSAGDPRRSPRAAAMIASAADDARVIRPPRSSPTSPRGRRLCRRGSAPVCAVDQASPRAHAIEERQRHELQQRIRRPAQVRHEARGRRGSSAASG